MAIGVVAAVTLVGAEMVAAGSEVVTGMVAAAAAGTTSMLEIPLKMQAGGPGAWA